MSKQRLSNLADNCSHVNHVTWHFFHNIKQFQSAADCASQKVQLQADARLSLFIWRHTQYVNRVKNWFVIQNHLAPEAIQSCRVCSLGKYRRVWQLY